MCEVCVNAHFGQLHLNAHPLLKLFPGCTCQMKKAGGPPSKRARTDGGSGGRPAASAPPASTASAASAASAAPEDRRAVAAAPGDQMGGLWAGAPRGGRGFATALRGSLAPPSGAADAHRADRWSELGLEWITPSDESARTAAALRGSLAPPSGAAAAALRSSGAAAAAVDAAEAAAATAEAHAATVKVWKKLMVTKAVVAANVTLTVAATEELQAADAATRRAWYLAQHAALAAEIALSALTVSAEAGSAESEARLRKLYEMCNVKDEPWAEMPFAKRQEVLKEVRDAADAAAADAADAAAAAEVKIAKAYKEAYEKVKYGLSILWRSGDTSGSEARRRKFHEMCKVKDGPWAATHGPWWAAKHQEVLEKRFNTSLNQEVLNQEGLNGGARPMTTTQEQIDQDNVDIRKKAIRILALRGLKAFVGMRYCSPLRVERDMICEMCDRGYIAGVVFWLNKGIDPNTVDIYGDNRHGHYRGEGGSLLYIATKKGHVVLVDLLLRRGVEVDKAKTTDGSTPLLEAAWRDHLKIVYMLIEAGADVNKTGTRIGCTALYMAAAKGHLKIVETLLQYKADVNKTGTTGVTPLFIAAAGGHLETVRMLTAAGALVDKVETNGWTPLLVAAQEGHNNIVEELIHSGADVNKTDPAGATPLHSAVYNDHGEVVETLLVVGADVNKALMRDGATALYMAAQKGNLVIVTLLLANSADVNKARTIDGGTPLYVAASLGHTAIVSHLLEHGADKSIRNFQNDETPLEVAQRNNYVAIIVLLAAWDAPPLR